MTPKTSHPVKLNFTVEPTSLKKVAEEGRLLEFADAVSTLAAADISVYEATLPELVARYFAGGYADFSHFCRTVYADVLPGYPSPIVPWDEILSERSWLAPPPADTQAADPTVF